MLALFILAPLLGLIVLNLPLGRMAAKLAMVVGLLLSAGQVVAVALRPDALFSPTGPFDSLFTLALSVDSLSRMVLGLIGLIAFVTLLVAQGMLTQRRQQFLFTSLVLVAMIGMNGICLVNDLFSLYVFLEVASIASFILIAMNKDGFSLEGAFKYIVLSAVASVLMVLAIAMLLVVSGTTTFTGIASAMSSSPNALLVKVAMGALVCGLLIKGGLVPFHGWVIGAYSAAPAPTSVLLAGVVSKVVGVYTLIRLVISVFGSPSILQPILLTAGVASAVVGALAALGQSDMKRLLAWSSISQMGYILMGLGCACGGGAGAELGLAGAVFHFFNHATFKSLLFVNAAAVEQRVGTTDTKALGGLGSRMPWTSTTSALAALSTAGVPPLSGFWSKLVIIIALWQSGHTLLAGTAVAVSVLTLAYMLLMQRKVFFGIIRPGLEGTREASASLVLPSVLLAAITVGVGVAAPLVPQVYNALKAVVSAVGVTF